MEASMYSKNVVCQTKKYLPDDMDYITHPTILVSLSHLIPSHTSLDSMKKYKMFQMEMEKGK